MSAMASAGSSDGVPPPRNTLRRSTAPAHGAPATRSISPRSAGRKRSTAPGASGAVLNEQYPHRFVQNGTCRYAPTDRARGTQVWRLLIPASRAQVVGNLLGQPVPQSSPAGPVALAVPRPVNQESLAADLLAPDESPVPAVLGVVPIVAHNEVRALRHHERIAPVQIAAMARGHGRDGAGPDVGLVDEAAVEYDPVVLHLHGVAPDPDDALDEVTALVVRVLEHDDVAVVRLPQPGQVHVRERQLCAVEELVHEDVVADQQRVHHRA